MIESDSYCKIMLSRLLFITLLPVFSLALEPLTMSFTAAGVASSAAYIYQSYLKCMIWECCQKPWVRETPSFDFSDLYGQPLAVQVVGDTLKRRHLLSKPLSLSFHGPPGTGKTFLSTILAKILFERGERSEFFHFFTSAYHFPNPEKDLEYNEMLNNIIKSSLKKCEKSVFVFEEFEKMPPKAVSAITSFLDPRGHVDEVNTRQALFIFISNLGQEAVISKAYELWKNGIHRNDFKIRDFESQLRLAAQENTGPYKDNQMEKKSLINTYIPFLPLEKQHVKSCIERDFWTFNNRSATPQEVEDILKDVPFIPEKNYLYAFSGCLKVNNLVMLYNS